MSLESTDRVLGGRYRLIREIARGGMAIVWEAQDSLLERHVAVKLLHLHFAGDPEFLERFRREARAAARLSHPNIVSIYDVGEEAETHTPFIVMELVEGGNLKDRIRRGAPLPDAEIRAVGAALASTLEYAHQRGIIHRDVKPQNVLLGEDGRPRLTDFGIAQAMAATGLTRTGAVMGSVHYLAPELVRGRAATPRSDCYGLGAVLYEMATGQVPFQGETDLAIALAHVEENPSPPRALNPRLAADLERTILRALAKSPEQRFATAAEMATALRTVSSAGAGKPTVEGADGPTQRIPTLPFGPAVPRGRPPNAGLGARPPETGARARPPSSEATARPSGSGAGSASRPAAAPARSPLRGPVDRPSTPAPAQATVAAASAAGGARRTARPQPARGGGTGLLVMLLALAAVLVALGAGFFGLATLNREAPPTAVPTPAAATAVPTAPAKPAAVPSNTPQPSPTPEASATPSPSPTPVPPTATPVPPTPTPKPPPTPTASPRALAVPELRGKTLDDARTALQAVGLTVTVRGVNANVDKNVVVDQAPDTGNSVPPGGTVTIVVGTGSTTIPDVVNLPRDRALKTLQDNSFHVIVRERRDPRFPPGTAIDTTPKANAVAPRGSDIELAVSAAR